MCAMEPGCARRRPRSRCDDRRRASSAIVALQMHHLSPVLPRRTRADRYHHCRSGFWRDGDRVHSCALNELQSRLGECEHKGASDTQMTLQNSVVRARRGAARENARASGVVMDERMLW